MINKILKRILNKEIETVEAFEQIHIELDKQASKNNININHAEIGEQIQSILILKSISEAKEKKKRSYNKAKIDVNLLSEFLCDDEFSNNKEVLNHLLDAIS